ncbi:hypothetical protein CBL_05558 [Carabus blaptoides fortunei]
MRKTNDSRTTLLKEEWEKWQSKTSNFIASGYKINCECVTWELYCVKRIDHCNTTIYTVRGSFEFARWPPSVLRRSKMEYTFGQRDNFSGKFRYAVETVKRFVFSSLSVNCQLLTPVQTPSNTPPADDDGEKITIATPVQWGPNESAGCHYVHFRSTLRRLTSRGFQALRRTPFARQERDQTSFNAMKRTASVEERPRWLDHLMDGLVERSLPKIWRIYWWKKLAQSWIKLRPLRYRLRNPETRGLLLQFWIQRRRGHRASGKATPLVHDAPPVHVDEKNKTNDLDTVYAASAVGGARVRVSPVAARASRYNARAYGRQAGHCRRPGRRCFFACACWRLIMFLQLPGRAFLEEVITPRLRVARRKILEDILHKLSTASAHKVYELFNGASALCTSGMYKRPGTKTSSPFIAQCSRKEGATMLSSVATYHPLGIYMTVHMLHKYKNGILTFSSSTYW